MGAAAAAEHARVPAFAVGVGEFDHFRRRAAHVRRREARSDAGRMLVAKRLHEPRLEEGAGDGAGLAELALADDRILRSEVNNSE